MKATAKLAANVTAIRVRKEVIADVGDWLVFDDKDNITVVSDAAFKMFYQGSNGSRKKAEPPPRRDNIRNADRGIARLILTRMGNLELTSAEIAQKVERQVSSVSAIVSSLKHQGYLSFREMAGQRAPYYRLTEQGRDLVAQMAAQDKGEADGPAEG